MNDEWWKWWQWKWWTGELSYKMRQLYSLWTGGIWHSKLDGDRCGCTLPEASRFQLQAPLDRKAERWGCVLDTQPLLIKGSAVCMWTAYSWTRAERPVSGASLSCDDGLIVVRSSASETAAWLPPGPAGCYHSHDLSANRDVSDRPAHLTAPHLSLINIDDRRTCGCSSRDACLHDPKGSAASDTCRSAV